MDFGKWIGKYLAEVTDVDDPDNGDRVRGILLQFPDLGEMGWALPCVPKQSDSLKATAKTGDLIWIEFLHGDMDYPIFAGFVPDEVKEFVERTYMAMEGDEEDE